WRTRCLAGESRTDQSRFSEEAEGEGEPGLATTLNLLKRSCQEIRIVKLELSLEVDPDSDDEKTWAARGPTAKKVLVELRRRLVVRWFMLYKLLDGTFMFGGQPQAFFCNHYGSILPGQQRESGAHNSRAGGAGELVLGEVASTSC
ncbi:hypothetical protein FOZ63_033102, partial [Perkinsus olseni]